MQKNRNKHYHVCTLLDIRLHSQCFLDELRCYSGPSVQVTCIQSCSEVSPSESCADTEPKA